MKSVFILVQCNTSLSKKICCTFNVYSKTSLARTRITDPSVYMERIFLAWSKVLGFIQRCQQICQCQCQ